MGAADSKLNLLLVGRAGNGKSSSGNAIVGSQIFSTYGNTTSITRRVKMYEGDRWNYRLTVVDTPGLMDTWMNEFEGCYFARTIMENVFKICEGFHAILIVLNITNRYSIEEQKVIRMLKEIFGPSLFQFVVLVFTHGDNFDQDNNIRDEEQSPAAFLEWCNRAGGELKSLLQACNNRAVLFHNNLNYAGNRDVEVRALLRHAQIIKESKHSYMGRHFNAAKKSREALILTFCLNELKLEIRMELNALRREFQSISNPQRTLLSTVNEFQNELTRTGDKTLLSFGDDVTGLNSFTDDQINNAKHALLSEAKENLRCESINKLQALTTDIDRLLNPEKSKLKLRKKIRELLFYVNEEAHGTRLLDDEKELIELFQTDVELHDARRQATTTEIE